MRDLNKQKRLVQYFRNRFAAPLVLFVLAAFFISIGVTVAILIKVTEIGITIALIGLVLGIIGLFIALLYGRRRVSDQVIDEWIREDMNRFEKQALHVMKLESGQILDDPVVVYGPKLSMAKSLGMFVRKGSDGVIRYTPAGVRVFAFTDKHLYVYSSLFSFLDGLFHQEAYEKIDYEDIQFVGTRTEVCSSWGTYGLGMQRLSAATVFQVRTIAGRSHPLVVASMEVEKTLGGTLAGTSEVEKAIEQIWARIKERKKALDAI